VLTERWLRIIPVAFVMYTIAFIDRTNISLALPRISLDLQMDAAQGGGAAGAFFWGYFLLQIPGGFLASRWSAKHFVSLLLVTWGVCAIACGFVRSKEELWVMRFLLGIAQGGVWPATLVLLANWFPRVERARANSYWMLCLPAAMILSSPLSGWILDGWGWRVLLISEGLLPFAWLPVWLTCIHDSPDRAPWISASERQELKNKLHGEAAEIEGVGAPVWRTLISFPVVVLVVINFLIATFNYGCLFWFPSAFESLAQLSSFETGVLYALPYLLAGVGMVLFSRHSDKTGERRNHVAIGLALSGTLLLLGSLLSGHWLLVSFALICFSSVGSWGVLGSFWAIPTETLPRASVGAALGLINAIGNLGGYAGPKLVGYLTNQTGNFVFAFSVLSLLLLLGTSLLFCVRSQRVAVEQNAVVR